MVSNLILPSFHPFHHGHFHGACRFFSDRARLPDFAQSSSSSPGMEMRVVDKWSTADPHKTWSQRRMIIRHQTIRKWYFLDPENGARKWRTNDQFTMKSWKASSSLQKTHIKVGKSPVFLKKHVKFVGFGHWYPDGDDSHNPNIWWCPKMGRPPVLIHLFGGYH
jgi:hypothetical protein